ncbi:restriction endonuclease subunit S [Bradyrhizobium sp. NBAIM01]|uniref:restriction endonuclease subunit S n=1 Tax=Bradyrhizobium sp. NBAIM01 TaxID=2793818 RepID=UPI001CD21E1F|nr:restriction endonuclease subunit S [Bradyrhizobium sp. NBAIM01]MCA1513647.1 restriction endonuclease subunit S [Bradyrhizobium sp. NBAIM01]
MPRLRRFGDILQEANRLISVEDDVEYRCGGVRWHGHGVFIREYKYGADILKKFVQHTLNAGDIVYCTLFAKSGAFAVADDDVAGAILSEKFPTFELVDSEVNPKYLKWFFRSGQLNRIAEEQATGMAAFSLSHLSKSKFLKLLVPVPDAARQQEVISLCEKIDEQARAASTRLQQNVDVADHLLTASCSKAFADCPIVKLGSIGQYVQRPAIIVPDDRYMQVTVAMNHKGLRLRRICDGMEIKSPGQCFVQEGDLLFSRIDLRNGAIGFVNGNLAGAVVTRDFPVFGLNQPSDLARRFLRYVFLSPAFMKQVQNASKGTTNRQKLKRERFLEIEVPWPSEAEQERIVSHLNDVAEHVRSLTLLYAEQQVLSKKFASAAISSLFSTDSGFGPRHELASELEPAL